VPRTIYSSAGETPRTIRRLPWDGLGGAEVDNAAASPRTAAIWDFASPGVYTLRLGIREDGVAVDTFVLQLASLGPQRHL